MTEHHTTEEKLSASAPRLNDREKAALWNNIQKRLPAETPTPSPYWFNFTSKKHMAPIALALMLMLGGSGVVAAAEMSRPGDSLFVIEQKIEDLRLALASDDKKTQLEARFAAERLLELSEILNESITVAATTTATSTRDTKRELRAESEVRVNEAVAITLGYLLNGSFGDDEREELLTELSLMIDGVPVRIDDDRLRIKDTNTWVEIREDDDDSRLEIRDGNDRIRIREKDGELRIDTKGDFDDLFEDDDWDDIFDDSDDDRNDDRDDRDDDRGEFEAEADVFSDRTIVKVEINDEEETFETRADSRAGIVSEISSRFDINEATVNAELDLEFEGRSSRAYDKDDDDRDDD